MRTRCRAVSIFRQVTSGLTHFWQNTATIEFRPVNALNANITARQLLDLRDYRGLTGQRDSTDRGQAAYAERLQLLGSNLGLERERTLTSALNFSPTMSPWFRPRS